MHSWASLPSLELDLSKPYVKQQFYNRARIRTPQGAHWLSVPVKKMPSGTPLQLIEIENSTSWRQDHLKGLVYNYATSPYFEFYEPDIKALIAADWVYLIDLTSATTRWCATTLGLKFEPESSGSIASDSSLGANSSELPSFIHPQYRQNFDGFIPGMSILDLLFNHGPQSKKILLPG